jgi:polar amino acid transport system substrate-binding protein
MKPVVLLLCLVAAARVHAGCSVNALYDDYPPFSYAGTDGSAQGFDVDALRLVLAAMDCSARISGLPWDDVLVAIKAGKADVAVGVGYHPERADWTWYSEPFREERVGLVLRKGESARFPGATLLSVMEQGLRFGRTLGDSDTPAVAAALHGHEPQLRAAVSEEDNFRRLLAGEIDGFLIERRFGVAVAAQVGATDGIEFHPLALTPGRYRFMFGRQVTPRFVQRFDAALQRLLYEDAFAPLARRYGVE